METPAFLADCQATTVSGEAHLTLTAHQRFDGKRLSQDPSAHRDPITTALTPGVEKGEGSVLWLVGHVLSAHEHPADTVVTYALLVEQPREEGPVRAAWFENHMEVPTELYTGSLHATPQPGGAWRLQGALAHTDDPDPLKLNSLLRVR